MLSEKITRDYSALIQDAVAKVMRNLLDNISNNKDLANILEQLKIEFQRLRAIFSGSLNQHQLECIVRTLKYLKPMHDFFNDSIEYQFVAEDHIEDFKGLFMNSLQAELINLLPRKFAAIADVALEKQKRTLDKVNSELLSAYAGRKQTLKKTANPLLTALTSLLPEAEDLTKREYYADEYENVYTKLLNILQKHSIKLDTPTLKSLDLYDPARISETALAANLHEILLNLISLCSNHKLRPETFNQYSSGVKAYIIKSPTFIFVTEKTEFELCIKIIGLINSTDDAQATNLLSNIFGLSVNEEQMRPALENLLRLLQNENFTLEEFKTYSAVNKKLFIADSRLALQLVAGYGISASIFATQSAICINDSIKKLNILLPLMAESNITMSHMLALPENILKNIMAHNSAIRDFCTRLDISLTEFLQLDPAQIDYLLADQAPLQMMILLNDYYFLPVKKMLNGNLDQLKYLVKYPQHAAQLFNAQKVNSSGNIDHDALKQSFEKSSSIVENLKAARYLVDLPQLYTDLEDMLYDWLQLGFNFLQCRAVYEVLIEINSIFVHNYLNQITGSKPCSQFVINFSDVKLLFKYSDANIITTHILKHVRQLEECLEFNRNTVNTQFHSPIQKTLEHLVVDGQSAFDYNLALSAMAEVNKHLEPLVQHLSVGNIMPKHLCILANLLNSKLCLQEESMDWRKFLQQDIKPGYVQQIYLGVKDQNEMSAENHTFMSFYRSIYALKQIIDSFNQKPQSYISRFDANNENSLFKAIAANDNLKAKEIIGSHKPDLLTSNNKGIGYYACVLNSANDSLIYSLGATLKTATRNKLRGFLQSNWFTDVDSINKHGYTPLTLAISQKNTEIIQVLLIHGAQVDLTNTRGENPLALAQVSNNFFVLNDLLAIAQYTINAKHRDLTATSQKSSLTIAI